MAEGMIDKVPHLTTALTGPLLYLEKRLLEKQVTIETWLRQEWQKTSPPFYCSVDLRNAGFKLAPVDTNLFPGGFNNLNPQFMPLCIQALQATVAEICSEIEGVLLIPESHTRNIFYFENLSVLHEIIQKAGFTVRIGSLLEEIKAPKEIKLPSGRTILLEPLTRRDDRLYVGDFSPCLVLLNNDLASGVPPMLRDIKQKIMPSLALGWDTRLKSIHFQKYQFVANEFAKQCELDPWLITPMFKQCGEINFKTGEGEDCLVRHTTELLKAIQQKYNEYNITQNPFVVIKADAGTYGMAVMSVQDPEQIRHLNRKQRIDMSSAKGGREVRQVIIQEGVYSFETWGREQTVAEPVVYMIGRHVIGGFYRVHAGRGVDENLNAPGMNFQPLAFADACNNPGIACSESENRFYAYGVIARLALLAAAREFNEVMKS